MDRRKFFIGCLATVTGGFGAWLFTRKPKPQIVSETVDYMTWTDIDDTYALREHWKVENGEVKRMSFVRELRKDVKDIYAR